MKWKLLITIFYISQRIVSASPQVPDFLIYKGDTVRTYNLIVEQFLQKQTQDNGELFGLSFRNSIDGSLGSTSNCWRGYQAIYKVKNDSLFVTDIIGCHLIEKFNKENSKAYLNKLFGNKVKNDKVFVDWFSGIISFPINTTNNKVLRWDGVFENIFMYETVLKIEIGIVLKATDEMNYTDLENGINRYKRDSISNIMFEEVKKYNWQKLDKFDCSEKFIITINENGKVGNIGMAWSDDEIKEYFTRREYSHCINSMENALSLLQFDIIKRKGEPMTEQIGLEIWFEEDGSIDNWTD